MVVLCGEIKFAVPRPINECLQTSYFARQFRHIAGQFFVLVTKDKKTQYVTKACCKSPSLKYGSTTLVVKLFSSTSPHSGKSWRMKNRFIDFLEKGHKLTPRVFWWYPTNLSWVWSVEERARRMNYWVRSFTRASNVSYLSTTLFGTSDNRSGCKNCKENTENGARLCHRK